MSKRFFTLLSLLIAFSIQLRADYTTLIKEAGTSKDFPGANYVAIFDSTQVNMEPTGLSHVNNKQLIKILSDKGALDKRIVKFSYEPLSALVKIKEVKIYRNNGTVEDVDISKNVYDYPAPARMIYWGAREKMVNIGHLEVGDAIYISMYRKGYTYALLQSDDEQYIPPMRGHFYDIVPFYAAYPIMEKVYAVRFPKEKKMQYKVFHGEADIDLKEDDSTKEYSFSMKNLLPIQRENHMVDLSDIAPKVLLSTSPDWEAKSLWFYGVNEDYGSFNSTSEIDKKIKEILVGAKSEQDTIARLTHWVADEIRYSGISMGEGEGYTLHTGDMTFTDRCGVCKDKAGMLVAMLRAVGFESYPAMTMAGSRIEDIPADQFNHSVTVVKRRNGKYELLDPTWVPFVRELWSSAEQQQNYLMGLPNGADLMITPISNPENHLFNIQGQSEISKDGTYKGRMIINAEGQSDAAIRRSFVKNFIQNWRPTIEKYILNIAPQAIITGVEYNKNPYNHQEEAMILTISYEIPDYALVTDDEIIFTPVSCNNFMKRVMTHLYISTREKEKKYAFKDRCSRLVNISETITLPFGKKIISKRPESTGNKLNSYSSELKIQDQTVSLSQHIKLGKRVYESSDYPSFKDVVDAQKAYSKPITIKR
ncbi:MAG: DUF3857 domain-containing transglutaminase family protein [Hyphomicrobiales bacterium]